ncbi:acetyl/propionyl/methylcrotonyl-CoA carboxylase subunit alpha [Carboxydocella sp. ULO1]|uniref:acetyl-CoA carboxylase biotin carboxylase subunit n=1 Tax=Carboxydocella sp. ULO1 TaxID=1926599 RepID=UPI0009ACD10D|nr:biotin carboxylase N-terminal domain-containing protein [Carboxydocella sp. ULO1]GAW27946.1 acetyl-CoA carboxylase biotin carboxylase subunit [Carboxydocella sp. ULO1]
MFKKVLIANRGEIACRIIKAAKTLDIKTVVVYSTADENTLPTRLADEAICIGPPPVAQSYLQMDKILEVALQTGCDCIHPGYGLLSENAKFAEKVRENNLVFIGPSPEIIAAMGDKVAARKTMAEIGIPLLPGSDEIEHLEEAKKMAENIGFPVILKAASGGGGIGMAIINSQAELEQMWSSVRQRAQAYFGNPVIYIEKYLPNPRHIEVQILGDEHGHCLAIGERDCSIQRRHQKVIEEAPAPNLPQEVREQLFDLAERAGTSLGYVGAGTFEFLVDENYNLYFLEMNTRIQVEHPVTEEVTGWNLVAWQFQLAAGAALPATRPISKGWAIEARLYAEDDKTCLPAPGKIETVIWPEIPGIRIETWIESGLKVTPYYDPLLAKIIAHGESREEARLKLIQTLTNLEITGIKTNRNLLVAILTSQSFQSGKYNTQFLTEFLKSY